MKFLVIGCGSIGRRHAKNLLALRQKVIATDIFSPNRRIMEENFGVKTFQRIEDAMKLKPNAIIVCTPPNSHIPLAVKGLRRKIPVFVEKPLSASASGIKRLFSIAKRNRAGFFVGCNLRFTQGLQMVKKLLVQKAIGRVVGAEINFGYYLPFWRPGTDYRRNYAASRKMGGGVMLDAIHEIDYAIWLFGCPKEVFAVYGKKSDLEIETEDFAEIKQKHGDFTFKMRIIDEPLTDPVKIKQILKI